MPRAASPWLVLAVLALSACGEGTPPAAQTATATAAASGTSGNNGEAVARIGETTVRASVVQTSHLPPSIARRYGLQRDPGLVLLLVTVRQGDGAPATAPPLRVGATATDLRGGRQPIPMREIRVDDPATGPGQALVDHIGTVRTSLPETLRFEVAIAREDGGTATLRLTRDFHP